MPHHVLRSRASSDDTNFTRSVHARCGSDQANSPTTHTRLPVHEGAANEFIEPSGSYRLPRMPLQAFALTETPPGVRFRFDNQVSIDQVRSMFSEMDQEYITGIDEPRKGQGVVKVYFSSIEAAQAALNHRLEGMIRQDTRDHAIQRQLDAMSQKVEPKINEMDAILALMRDNAEAAKAIIGNLTALPIANPVPQATQKSSQANLQTLEKEKKSEYRRGIVNENSRLRKHHRKEIQKLKEDYEKEKAHLMTVISDLERKRLPPPTPGLLTPAPRLAEISAAQFCSDSVPQKSSRTRHGSIEFEDNDEDDTQPARPRKKVKTKSVISRPPPKPMDVAPRTPEKNQAKLAFVPNGTSRQANVRLEKSVTDPVAPTPQTPVNAIDALFMEAFGLMTPVSPASPFAFSSPLSPSTPATSFGTPSPMAPEFSSSSPMSSGSPQMPTIPTRRRSDVGLNGLTMRRKLGRSPIAPIKIPGRISITATAFNVDADPDTGVAEASDSKNRTGNIVDLTADTDDEDSVLELVQSGVHGGRAGTRTRRRSAEKACAVMKAVVKQWGTYKGR